MLERIKVIEKLTIAIKNTNKNILIIFSKLYLTPRNTEKMITKKNSIIDRPSCSRSWG